MRPCAAGYHVELMRLPLLPLRQFCLFVGVGAFSTSLHYAVLLAMVGWLHWRPVAAASLGYAAGALAGYVLNYTFTFGSRAPHRAALPRYTAMVVGGAALNAALVWLGLLAGAHYLAAQVGATAVVLLANFGASRVWTFKGNDR